MENSNIRLTPAQLGRRLGAGLKILAPHNKIKELNGIECLDLIFIEFGAWTDRTTAQIWNCKPILYNFDMLTKEITHNGETFVPVERLQEFYMYHDIESKIIRIQEDNNWAHHLEHFLIQHLISWHFRIDEPEGSFVDVSTLTENPYK